MADKNTTSNINLAAAEELPKAQSKFKEFIKKFMKRKTAVISLANGNHRTVCSSV